MKFCRDEFHEDTGFWVCAECEAQVESPGLRKCPYIPAEIIAREDVGAAWLTCKYRGEISAYISPRVSGCRCSAGKVPVHQCLYFNEPVIKQGEPPCLDTLREKVPGATGLTCRECQIPGHCDILHVTHRDSWQDQVRRSEYALCTREHRLTAGEIVKPTSSQLNERIETALPRLVIVHGFCFPMSGLIQLASENRNIQFVSVDHSSLNHTFTWPQYFGQYRQVLEASQRVPNLWASAVDRWASWDQLGYDRFFTWVNPLYLPDNRESAPVDPPTLMITGRVDWMKALPSQLTAAALVQRRRGIHVLISWTDSSERQAGLREHAGACGLKYESLPYGDFDEWYRRLREQVSIVLQPSMSDSFNIVTVEAAAHGRPFVGSPTIPHTPDAWRVSDPNNPREIAEVTERILDGYPAASAQARQLADEVTARNNKAYSEIIGRLLNGR